MMETWAAIGLIFAGFGVGVIIGMMVMLIWVAWEQRAR